MIQIVLPSSNRRAMLRAFWLVLSLIVGSALTAVTWAWGGARAFTVGAACGLMILTLVFGRESDAWRIYRLWNRWLARPVALLASWVVLRVCFLIVRMAALGGPSRMNLGSGSKAISGWTARSSLASQTYPLPYAGSASTDAWGGWAGYRQWASETGNSWAIFLLPFLVLLRCFDPEGEKAFTANIYTLF